MVGFFLCHVSFRRCKCVILFPPFFLSFSRHQKPTTWCLNEDPEEMIKAMVSLWRACDPNAESPLKYFMVQTIPAKMQIMSFCDIYPKKQPVPKWRCLGWDSLVKLEVFGGRIHGHSLQAVSKTSPWWELPGVVQAVKTWAKSKVWPQVLGGSDHPRTDGYRGYNHGISYILEM